MFHVNHAVYNPPATARGRVRLTRHSDSPRPSPPRRRREIAAINQSNREIVRSRRRGWLGSIASYTQHAPNRHRPTANRTRNMKTKMKTASKRSRDTANTLDSPIIISYAVHVFIISGVITLDRLSRHDHVMQNTAGGQLQWACGTWGSCGPCAVDWLRTPGSSTHERFCHAPGWHPRASPCR